MTYSKCGYKKCVEDLFACQNVNLMSQFMQHGHVSCLDHSKSVSYGSYVICKILKLDYRSAARGGLLHDYFLYDWHDSTVFLHGVSHPRLALKNAQRDFEINKIECDIIKKHMWPLTFIPPKYCESMIINLVDKYCTIAEFFKLSRSQGK